MSTNNSRSSKSQTSFEKLLFPSQAKDEITKLVDDAIDQASKQILKLKKKKKNKKIREKCSKNCCIVESSKRLNITNDNNSINNTINDNNDNIFNNDNNDNDEKYQNSKRKRKDKKKKSKKSRKSSTTTTVDVDEKSINFEKNDNNEVENDKVPKQIVNEICQCSAKTLPLPVSHGVFPEEPLFFRDRYFECSGTAMYTREIFLANGKKLKVDRKKLAKLRGLPEPEECPVKPSDANIVINEYSGHQDKSSKKHDTDSRQRTIVVKDIAKNAKGMSITLKVNVVKKSGEEKQVEFSVDMPDFEPSCLRYGKKIAFLE